MAALASTVWMTDASATVVTFSTPINVPSNIDGIYINFLTGASATLATGVAGWDWNPYNSGTSLSFFWSATPSQASGVASTTTGPYTALTAGSVISSASTFAQVTATAAAAAFQPIGTHLLGFRFYNESTTTINYGYATLVSSSATGFPLTVTGWSFENSGGAITIPAVPEPESVLMLSLGALVVGGLNMRRLRRERRNAGN